MSSEEVETARVAGIRQRLNLSLSDIEHRRAQLWVVSILVLVGLTMAIVLLSFASELLPEPVRVENWPARPILILVSALAVTFVVYVLEKERALRRLSSLLLEEKERSSELSDRLGEMSTLAEVGKAMNATLALEEVFDLILSSALQILKGTEGSIMLLEKGGRSLRVMSYRGPSPDIGDARIAVGSGIAGTVAEQRRPLMLHGSELGDLSHHAHPERGIHSAMSVPLQRSGELVGVLNVNEVTGDVTFGAPHLEVLEFFAEYAAIAIANAKQFEKERETISRLEELDRLRSDFVATVSHELKTPLTAIIAAAKTLAKSGPTMERTDFDGFLDIVVRQGNRLLRLVEDVLTTSRIESGIAGMRRESIDLHGLAQQVVGELLDSEERRERVVDIRAVPERLVMVGDPATIGQIMSNLIENALKYSTGDDKVTIALEEYSDTVMIEVSDTGYGIPTEQLAQIFEKFHQVDSSSTRRVGGFGLGLYIVASLVRAHGGTIDVESEIGVGSTFRVHLPKHS